nr:unnamed protein product [Digitaria exilis]
MDVQVQRSFTIPPPATKSEEVPLTVFSLFMPSYYYTILFAFTSPNPTNAALVHALTTTLSHFPLLTARLTNKPRRRHGAAGGDDRRPCFVIGDQGSGALVVEAAVSASPLSDHLPLVPSPELALLHPPVVDEQGAAATPHLFRVQITRFACGGLVIATSVQHQAADGCSLSTFLHAWAGAVRAGGGVPRLDHPVPYGPGALVPRCPPRCEFEHRGVEFLPLLSSPQPEHPPPPAETETTTTNMLLHYTGEFVAELRASVQDRHTAFEAVSAHLWRKVTAARGCAASGDGDDADTRTTTMIKVAVDGRRRLAGREAVFGNLALTALSRTAVGKLVAKGGLADAAALVRAGVRAVDGRYFQSFIDFGALHGDEELVPIWEKPSETNFLDLEVDSWLRLGFDRLDFGLGGRLVGILPARIPLDGVVVLIPSMREAGGIHVLVALHDKPARVLKDIAYTID